MIVDGGGELWTEWRGSGSHRPRTVDDNWWPVVAAGESQRALYYGGTTTGEQGRRWERLRGGIPPRRR